MALRRKGSAPWSATKEAGLSDAPVSGNPFVEGDEVKPVIDAGFIDEKGLWQISPSNDSAFTFQDPSQALAAGADMEFPINMLNHEMLILAILDSSGNDINIDLIVKNPTTLSGPYTPFTDVGVNGAFEWKLNVRPIPGAPSTATMGAILIDTNEALANTWQFYKITYLRGTQIRMLIHNNEGADAGTISTAYMRLV